MRQERKPAPSGVRIALGFIAAFGVTGVLASTTQSLLVLAALERAGAAFPFTVRLQVIAHDIVAHLYGGNLSYGLYILFGFAIAFPVAALLRRWLGVSRLVIYPLAGAACLAAILCVISLNFFYNMTFLEGTRGVSGYLSQLLSGICGGAAFALIAARRA
jgi:hypothetical protein